MSSSRPRRAALAVTAVLASGVMAATGGAAVQAAPPAAPVDGAVLAVRGPSLPRAVRASGRTTRTPATSRVAAVPAALRIAVVGDSVAWGQGLTDAHRASTLVRQGLAARTGRPVEVDVYAHSGAALAGACPAGSAAVPGELPFAAPSVACQVAAAAASGHRYDLVLMSGCINDLTVTAVLFGTSPVAGEVARRCARPLVAAVTAARGLPGAPRVVVTGYYPIVSHLTDAAAFAAALRSGLAPGSTAGPAALRRLAVRRSAQFTAAFDAVARRAVVPARGSAFVSPGLGAADALFAPRTKLWSGTDDEVAAARAVACNDPATTPPGTGATARQLCAVASVGHPNVAGAARYATRVLAAVARWFPRA